MLLLLACHGRDPVDNPPAQVQPTDTAEDTSAATSDTGGSVADLNGVAPTVPVSLPSFNAVNLDGAIRYPTDLVGTPTVLAFYPNLDGGSSVTEAKSYEDQREAFDILHVQLVGVSFAPPEDAQMLATRRGLTYEFWTDTDKSLALAYGAVTSADAPAPARRSVLLDSDGNLLLVYDPVNVVTGAAAVYDDCKLIFGQ